MLWASISLEGAEDISTGFDSDMRDRVAMVLARWKVYRLALLLDAINATHSLANFGVQIEFWLCLEAMRSKQVS